MKQTAIGAGAAPGQAAAAAAAEEVTAGSSSERCRELPGRTEPAQLRSTFTVVSGSGLIACSRDMAELNRSYLSASSLPLHDEPSVVPPPARPPLTIATKNLNCSHQVASSLPSSHAFAQHSAQLAPIIPPTGD